ncbi:hypothetical protein MBLNU459_g8496t1 [Dothideomycetes sp. NU459]
MTSAQAISLAESLRHALGTADEHDPIHGCGPSPLRIIQNRPNDVLSLAHEKIHTWKYTEVPECWRRLYEDASLWKVIGLIRDQGTHTAPSLSSVGQKRKRDNGAPPAVSASPVNRDTDTAASSDWISEVVYTLDMAMILTGAPGRRELILQVLESLQELVDLPETQFQDCFQDRLDSVSHPDTFVRKERLDFVDFQEHLDTVTEPLVIMGAIDHWPALSDSHRRWNSPRYLMSSTLGGRRLVPVELGRSYTDEDWAQRIMTFAEYMQSYLLKPSQEPTGYLAQHDLFSQVPGLAADTSVPDYCYTTPPPPPPPKTGSTVAVPTLEEPLRNAWLGPAGTVSPLHTDPYHNILCQVVGHKYVRLYAPSETSKLYPRGIDETGVNMENTSHVDISLVRKLYGQTSTLNGSTPKDGLALDGDSPSETMANFESQYPQFKDAKYVEGVLSPGECLYIPVGWWHYVESLSTSFSISFWWN